MKHAQGGWGRPVALIGSTAALLSLTAGASIASSEGAISAVPRALVSCYDSGESRLIEHQHPRECVFLSRGEVPMTASTVVVIHMRWTHWGSRKPTASGTYAGNMGVRIPVRVKLSRRLTCAVGERHYRRVTVTEKGKRKPLFTLPLDARCPSG